MGGCGGVMEIFAVISSVEVEEVGKQRCVKRCVEEAQNGGGLKW